MGNCIHSAYCHQEEVIVIKTQQTLDIYPSLGQISLTGFSFSISKVFFFFCYNRLTFTFVFSDFPCTFITVRGLNLYEPQDSVVGNKKKLKPRTNCIHVLNYTCINLSLLNKTETVSRFPCSALMFELYSWRYVCIILSQQLENYGSLFSHFFRLSELCAPVVKSNIKIHV